LLARSRPITTDALVDPAEKRRRIAESGFNAGVEAARAEAVAAIRDALDAGRYAALSDWVAVAWAGEGARAAAGRAPAAGCSGNQTLRVFATWFNPSPGDPL